VQGPGFYPQHHKKKKKKKGKNHCYVTQSHTKISIGPDLASRPWSRTSYKWNHTANIHLVWLFSLNMPLRFNPD
jgi:hypothetical protein